MIQQLQRPAASAPNPAPRRLPSASGPTPGKGKGSAPSKGRAKGPSTPSTPAPARVAVTPRHQPPATDPVSSLIRQFEQSGALITGANPRASALLRNRAPSPATNAIPSARLARDPASISALVNQLQGTRNLTPRPAGTRLGPPPAARKGGHHDSHHRDHDHDHDAHHRHHSHSHSHLLIRTVRIRPGLIPLGCSLHTYVGHQPIYSTLPPVPVAGYGEPAYAPPPPSYQNAPRFGDGSNFPSELNYQVDPSSQLSTQEIRFRKGSAEIADETSITFLLNLAAALNSPELINFSFVIEGHASAEGSSVYNQELSQLRANAVFQFLAGQGVNPARLLSVGHGESMARYAATAPEHLRAEDRRVVLYKLAQEPATTPEEVPLQP